MKGLPVEIIQTIFLQLCPPKTIFPLRQSEPRLVLTRVCSQWRATALSMPTLWANINIYAWDSYSALQPGPILAWISRTAQSTFSFKFRGSTEISSMIADLIFPVMHRCSFLTLHLNTVTLNRLLALPPNSLCTLRSIVLDVVDHVQVTESTPVATVFRSCPELLRFVLTAPKRLDNFKITNLNIPWHQLVTLRLGSPAIFAHECLDIIRACTCLQECRIYIPPVNDLALQRITELSREPVVLPSLHTLRIQFYYHGENELMFLHALRLPRLRKFRPSLVAWTSEHASWMLSVLQSVLCDTVQELDLSEFPISDSLSETLARVPILETLWLNDDYHEYPGIMRALGEGTISPHLTTLHLGLIESADLLFDILEARAETARTNHGVTALAQVTIPYQRKYLINKARLLALTETGMKFEFRSV
ncbi:hypothetical protein BD779DRAFT_1676334 [Infundibulicybe gibba]|nr:hypothetical protein BD779DRAFT_1676334 [Infundibulicybe gibba]